ncbi:hypothetical protein N9M66_05145 [Litoreibacter sp.]|nr:hypothetical protein [Litoreibacter sp.]
MIDDFESCILAAQAELKIARRLLQEEISGYPVPIAGCDVQFNTLLAERQKVSAALKSLEEVVFVPTPRTPTPLAGIESR